MDPLSVTASVVGIATLAWQSCKAAHDLLDRWKDAPQVIAKSKTSLDETQKTLDTLQQMLRTSSEPNALNSVLRVIELDETLKSAKRICDEFATAITSYTTHSMDGQLSKRDRLSVNFHESKINKFNRELGICQRTTSIVLISINLIVTTQTAGDIGRLRDQFQAQEQALADLDTDLRNLQISLPSEEDSASNLTAELRKVCEEALSATKAKHSGQKFGDMSTDNQSLAMQGIVGEAQDGVEQSFGSMKHRRTAEASRVKWMRLPFSQCSGNENNLAECPSVVPICIDKTGLGVAAFHEGAFKPE